MVPRLVPSECNLVNILAYLKRGCQSEDERIGKSSHRGEQAQRGLWGEEGREQTDQQRARISVSKDKPVSRVQRGTEDATYPLSAPSRPF